jgi:L-ascorbate metabolism protein UlaG (beta-lactamase superfamily)
MREARAREIAIPDCSVVRSMRWCTAVEVQLIRNATLVVEAGGERLLIDPMLDPKGSRPAIENTAPPLRNPLVELPVSADELVSSVDAVLVTHLHLDHFDGTAARLIGDGLPVFCQPGDEDELRRRGVTRAEPMPSTCRLGRVDIARTGGRHGVGSLADELGPVSGYVLSDGPRTLYIAGDTIWCDEVASTLARRRPDAVVVNAAGARFLDSERLVMDVDDVLALSSAYPDVNVIAVHLQAINHCPVTRAELRAATRGLRVVVPEDGETIRVGGDSATILTR